MKKVLYYEKTKNWYFFLLCYINYLYQHLIFYIFFRIHKLHKLVRFVVSALIVVVGMEHQFQSEFLQF